MPGKLVASHKSRSLHRRRVIAFPSKARFKLIENGLEIFKKYIFQLRYQNETLRMIWLISGRSGKFFYSRVMKISAEKKNLFKSKSQLEFCIQYFIKM